MLRTDQILSTIQMLQTEYLDVRTVTMGINVSDCAGPDVTLLCRKLRQKLRARASRLVEVCDRVGRKYGVPVTNKRLAISPVSDLLAGHGSQAALQIAETMDGVTGELGIDLIGGFTALVQKGITASDAVLLESLPTVLSRTGRVCASVNVASTRAGINVDAIRRLGELLPEIARATADHNGFGCAKLVVFANIPEDNPFMAGAYLGSGEPEAVVNIGVSGPGVVCSALRRRTETSGRLSLGDLAEEIKITAFRVTRAGELIGREVAAELDVPFGIVDLSLAPTPKIGDSFGEILRVLGVEVIGAPGSTAAVAMLNDAVKKGGAFASSSVGGLSGAFLPVAEDAALADAVRQGHLSLEKLEAMTSVCSVGLDMVVIPGDTPPATIAALLADEMAIGVINSKTTSARLIPAPGKRPGDLVEFGGLFGSAYVIEVRNCGRSGPFIAFGGRIPPPIHSLRN
jgi:uncharacterized protein (UPF0210 family)